MRNKATIHVVWNDYKGASTKKNLKLRVTFGGKPRLYATNSDEEFTEQEFKTLKKKVERGKGEYPKSVTKAVETATRIINQLGADFSFDVFSESYRRQLYGNYCSTDDIQNVFDLYTVSHPKGLSAHTIKDYQAAVNWALKCKDNLKIGDITSTFVKKLVGMLDRDGKSINTRKIYLRSLKAIYRFAVKKNMVIDTKPFEAQSLTSTRKMNFGLTEEDFIKKVMIDVPMPIRYATLAFVQELSRLEPFGNGNPKPVFADKALKVSNLRIRGKNGNVASFLLTDEGGYTANGIYFGEAQAFADCVHRGGNVIKILYYPEQNEFRGKVTLQIVVTSYQIAGE